MQLKILTWQNEEIASDALSIHGYEHYEATDYALAAWYPRQPKALGAPGTPAKAATPSERSSDFTKWWADGDEPLYYIVSSKVACRPCKVSLSHQIPLARQESPEAGWPATRRETGTRTPVKHACMVACGVQDVVVGKPRDGDDRVAWLLDHQRFNKALSVLETDRGLKKSTHAQVSACCTSWPLLEPGRLAQGVLGNILAMAGLQPCYLQGHLHIAGLLIVADSMLQLQVTQKYLEHLISQRQYTETAVACAKLLKVSLPPSLPSQEATPSAVWTAVMQPDGKAGSYSLSAA